MKSYKGTWIESLGTPKQCKRYIRFETWIVSWIESLGTPKQCKRYIRFETWIVRCLYRSGSLQRAA